MTVKVQSGEQLEQATEALENRAESIANITYTAPTETGEIEVTAGAESADFSGQIPLVGRNEPCPCGSGKKYKLCHGKLS